LSVTGEPNRRQPTQCAEEHCRGKNRVSRKPVAMAFAADDKAALSALLPTASWPVVAVAPHAEMDLIARAASGSPLLEQSLAVATRTC
jgi:hypothetical protein